jgi:predicted nucleic acid-binding protein
MFRHAASATTRTLGALLLEGDVCIHGIVRAEILSGSRSESEFLLLKNYLSAIPVPPDPDDLWDRVAVARFKLSRKGYQASIADLVIGVTAVVHRKKLFTLDLQFKNIQSALPFQFYQVE